MSGINTIVKCLITVIILLSYQPCFSQKINLSGKVTNIDESKPLANALITAIAKKDSFLISFVRTDINGFFKLPINTSADSIVVFASFPDFVDHIHIIIPKNITADSIINFNLASISHVLNEVIVTQSRRLIKLKGDTIEYNVENIKLPDNASVEELLKRLPGMQVDATGLISINGKRVQEILVDGEIFFGDDPTLISRNLKAKIIEKVQVFDKKSDVAAFLGIEDPKQKKAINIKTKAEYKKGFFGKLSSSIGASNYYHGDALFNYFRGNERIGFYVILSTISTSGINWPDQQSLATNNFSQNSKISDPLDTWNGNYNGVGLPTVKSIGFQYSNRLGTNGNRLNSNYKYSDLQLENIAKVNIRSILTDNNEINTQQNLQNKYSIVRNKFTFQYDMKLDSTMSLRFMSDIYDQRKGISTTITTEVMDSKRDTLSTESRTLNNAIKSIDGFGTVTLFKRFRKKGRAMTFSLNYNRSSLKSNGYLYSLNNYYLYSPSLNIFQNITDQKKSHTSEENSLRTELNYTEPLSSKLSLNILHSLQVTKNRTNYLSFNKNNLSYDKIDSTTSIISNLNLISHKIGSAIRWNNQKLSYSASIDISTQKIDFLNILNTTNLNRTFHAFQPRVSFNYSPDSRTSIGIGYSGTQTLPSIFQLQPLTINANPLIQIKGNEALTPSYTHGISLNLIKFRPLTNSNLFITSNATFTENAIVYNSKTDSIGKTIQQWVNTKGNRGFKVDVNYSFPAFQKWVSISIFTNYSLNNIKTIINEKNLFVINRFLRYGIGFTKDIKQKHSISLDLFGSAFKNSTENSAVDDKIRDLGSSLNIRYSFPLKLV